MSAIALRRVTRNPDASLSQASVPWPDVPAPPGGKLSGVACSLRPIGAWPSGNPRRLLVAAPVTGEQLVFTATDTPPAAGEVASTVTLEDWQESPEPLYHWASPWVRIALPDQTVQLALGLRYGDQVHWWEGVGLDATASGFGVAEYEARGAIPRVRQSPADLLGSDYASDLIHVHNWLYGHVRVVLHQDQLAEVTIRFMNSSFVDHGLDLTDVVPLVALRGGGLRHEGWRLIGDEGSIDLSDSAAYWSSLPTADVNQFPADDVLVWRPFPEVQVFGGACPSAKTGDPVIVHETDHFVPSGMARTVGVLIGPDDALGIDRHVAAGEAYVDAGEFDWSTADQDHPYAHEVEAARTYFRDSIRSHGFETGSVARYLPGIAGPAFEGGVEPGWEGEVAYSLFLDAWRTGRSESYEWALSNGRYFADVVVDHSVGLARMHGYAGPAVSVPMTRPLGTVAMWLETGDPWYLQTARRMVDAAWATHLNAWPRAAVGRDACFGRGAAMLLKYTGDEHYRAIALELMRHLATTQRRNGSFGDQGGGAGIHGWGGYVTKPWMGCLALGPALDMLDLEPGFEELQQLVLRFGRWLMDERVEFNHGIGWSYQHDYNGLREHLNIATGEHVPLPSQPDNWHHETLSRVLWTCTAITGDPAFVEALDESRATLARSRADRPYVSFDHEGNAILQFLPWLERRRSG